MTLYVIALGSLVCLLLGLAHDSAFAIICSIPSAVVVYRGTCHG